MDKIEVTQADREAAAAVLHDNLGWYRAAPVRAGEMDNDSVVQAFAAHRTNRTDATPVAWQRRRMWSYSFDPAGKVHLWEPCSAKEATGHFEKEAGYEYRALYTHPPATDVAALVEAAKKIMPIRVNDGPDYAEVYFADGEKHSTHAMTMNPQDWLDLSAALAPFTKGQP